MKKPYLVPAIQSLTSRRMDKSHFSILSRMIGAAKDSEISNLVYEIAKFTSPKLRRFKERMLLPADLPIRFDTKSGWREALDQMIYAMDFHIAYSQNEDVSDFIAEDVQKGQEIFGKFLNDLWLSN